MAGISERLRRLFRPDPDDIIPGDPLFYWSTVKKVASNDLTKIIGIVPVVGYLILFNDSILDKIQFNTITGTTGDEASPFLIGGLTKLRMTFFGSLSVTMSFLIYQLRRPKTTLLRMIFPSLNASAKATALSKCRRLSVMSWMPSGKSECGFFGSLRRWHEKENGAPKKPKAIVEAISCAHLATTSTKPPASGGSVG